jgi:predicted ATPase
MYITKVALENVRCFRKFTLDLESQGKPTMWTVVVGDNGDGKTTLLRSIAMGLCDESSAAAVHRELAGDFVRKGKKCASIEVHLTGEENVRYEINTTIKSLPAFERVTQEIFEVKGKNRKKLEQEDFPWKEIFVSGYGAGRQTQGTANFREYVAVDAVYTLFRYQEPLQNAELAFRRLVENARTQAGKNPKKRESRAEATLERLAELLRGVLNLESKGRVILASKGIEVVGHWGRAALGSLGDGYQSIITCVLDLLAWKMLSGRSLDPKKMSGIVLIDEVEQHLHPRWQLTIMNHLQKAFPKMQFIATTHSPLVVSGCEQCAVHALDRGAHKVYSVPGWLAEDVYQEVMGLPTSRPEPLLGQVEEFQQLHLKSLRGEASASDERRLKQMTEKLKEQLPGTDPVILTTKLANLAKRLEEARTEPSK